MTIMELAQPIEMAASAINRKTELDKDYFEQFVESASPSSPAVEVIR